MPAFYTYIIKCTDQKGNISFYTGSTKDLYKRFNEHLTGKGAKYTKGKKLELVYYETSLSNSEARRREAEIKTYSTARKKNLIEGKKDGK